MCTNPIRNCESRVLNGLAIREVSSMSMPEMVSMLLSTYIFYLAHTSLILAFTVEDEPIKSQWIVTICEKLYRSVITGTVTGDFKRNIVTFPNTNRVIRYKACVPM
jgi:hypothetical protein